LKPDAADNGPCKNYDLALIGQVCRDINYDYQSPVRYEPGGAVYYAGFAVSRIGRQVAVITKGDQTAEELSDVFRGSGADIYPIRSPRSTSIENTYLTESRERRTCRVVSRIHPYATEELPEVRAKVYYLAGLMRGDYGMDVLDWACARGDVALDIQSLLRCETDGRLETKLWPDYKQWLSRVKYFKADAAEAEVLTGLTHVYAAAKEISAMGPSEIMITHSGGLLVLSEGKIHRQPFTSANLTGRTGRGDTAFSMYIAERLYHSAEAATRFCAAGVSMKMEHPGPSAATRADVEKRLSAGT